MTLENYLPKAATMTYAVYSQALDRFLAIDHIDLLSLHKAAKLFSPKLQLSIVLFRKVPFDNNTCVNWTWHDTNKKMLLGSGVGTFARKLVRDPYCLVELGPNEATQEAKRYFEFILHAVRASQVADLFRLEHDFSLYNRIIDFPTKNSHVDFVLEVDKILFSSSSFEEAYPRLKKMPEHMVQSDFGAWHEDFMKFVDGPAAPF